MVLFHSASQVESSTLNSCITLCSTVVQCVARSMCLGETTVDLLCWMGGLSPSFCWSFSGRWALWWRP